MKNEMNFPFETARQHRGADPPLLIDIAAAPKNSTSGPHAPEHSKPTLSIIIMSKPYLHVRIILPVTRRKP